MAINHSCYTVFIYRKCFSYLRTILQQKIYCNREPSLHVYRSSVYDLFFAKHWNYDEFCIRCNLRNIGLTHKSTVRKQTISWSYTHSLGQGSKGKYPCHMTGVNAHEAAITVTINVPNSLQLKPQRNVPQGSPNDIHL